MYIPMFVELLHIFTLVDAAVVLYLLHAKKDYPARTYRIAYTLLILLPIVRHILRSMS